MGIAEYEPFARAMKPTNYKTSLREARETIEKKKKDARAAARVEKEKTKDKARK